MAFEKMREGISSLNAGAPNITYEGSEGPKAPMQMAGPDRYQKILEFKINELEGELGRDLTDEEYDRVSEEAYEEYHYGAKAPQGIENAVPASYEPGKYDEEDIKAYEQYKYDMEEQRPGMPIMDIDEFLRTERSTVAKGGRIKYNQGGRTGFQTGSTVQDIRVAPEWVESLGKYYASDLARQSGIPAITQATQQMPGETASQFAQRQAQAQQFDITQQSMGKLAPQVAGQDALQQAAYAQATDPTYGLGAYQDYTADARAAAQAAGALTGPMTTQQLTDYMSPYQQQVIDATMTEFDEQAKRQKAQQAANVLGTPGAYGGGRHGVLAAQYAAESDRNRAALLSQLNQQGFQQAQAGRQQDFANQQALATQQAGLGTQAMGNVQRQIAGLGTLGATQQAQTQAGLDADRQFAQMAVQEPVNRLGMLGTGVTGLMGGTQSYGTTIGQAPPQTSPLGTALGIGSTLAGIYGYMNR